MSASICKNHSRGKVVARSSLLHDDDDDDDDGDGDDDDDDDDDGK